jgi:hypothetical protein
LFLAEQSPGGVECPSGVTPAVAGSGPRGGGWPWEAR